jgi:hypothetical protein
MSKRRQIFALLMAAACGAASAAPLLESTAGILIRPPPPLPTANLVTYSGFVVTDVSLNGVRYHDAAVTLTFTGYKADVVPFSVTQGKVTVTGWKITKGTASVEIVSGAQVITAVFAPNQIFVSYDQSNEGFGFGSFVKPPAYFEPAYPLGIDVAANNRVVDLLTPVVQSGHGWSCIGFPPAVAPGNGHCDDPTPYPLHTDHGPFVIYMPYYATNASGLIVSDWEGGLNRAIFTIRVP